VSGIRTRKFEPLAFALALLWTLGCGRSPDPQKAFHHARQAFLRGDLPSAHREAHDAYQRFSGHDLEWAWRFRLLDAEVLITQGNREDALPLLSATLPPQLARSELAIKQEILQGSAYVPLDRLEESDQRLTAAQELAGALGSPLAAEIARARGALERRRNNLEGAEAFFRQSLRLAREQHDEHLEMTDLSNLGVVAVQVEHYDEAIDWSNAANEKAQLLEDRQTTQKTLGNLAWAYYKMGDFEKSLALGAEAEKKASELGTVHDQILWLNNLGLVYYQLNQFSVAEGYYRQSLALAQQSRNSAQIIDALNELAFVSVKTGNFTQAQQYSEQAFQLAHARNDRSSELSAILVEGEIAARQGKPEEAEEKFHEVANAKESDLSLRWQAQNDLAELYERDHRLPEADKQYQQALATIEQSRATLQHEEFKLPFLANAAHLYDDYIRFLVEQGQDRRALQVADYSRARTLAEGLGVLPKNSRADAPGVDPQQIASQAHATILFYWLGRKQSYLWAINGSHTARFPLPPAAEIDAAVQRYRQALLGWQDVLKTANADGAHLYDILVGPARKLVAPNSRVILITDGSLDGLNFETLLAPGSPASSPPLHYWIEDAIVLSASSLHVLAASQTHRERGTGKLLLIGDAASASPEYAPLPNAVREMENVESHFTAPARLTYTHDQATPAAYLASDPGQFSYIHFVAHATASKLSPLDSAIVLSRSSSEPDSFKLYARDITQHPLHADLVTISSCKGAGAEAYSGEGLIGLSWAFVRAGAHSVIGALWDVNDASTANLMDHLYDGLKRGQTPDAALRSAKLSLLHSDDVVRKPFYWAPFQLYTGR
jgi:CHAT domain-containing protein